MELLNESILKEGIDNFKITSHGIFELSKTPKIEKDLIISRNTLYPNGLNTTIQKREHDSETRTKIAETLSNITRYGHLKQELPRYIKFVNDKDTKGYGIIGHPKCKRKTFTTKLYNDDVLNDKFAMCSEFIKQLDSQ
jgi:hypothetical protein